MSLSLRSYICREEACVYGGGAADSKGLRKKPNDCGYARRAHQGGSRGVSARTRFGNIDFPGLQPVSADVLVFEI